MPIAPTYPGVYIEEVPSGVRSITGVATSIAAFLGYFSRGPLDTPVRISNFGDFERAFGGLRADSEASYAIQQFFFNGGGQAYVVRTAASVAAAASTLDLLDDGDVSALTLEALGPGVGGDALRVEVDYNASDPATEYTLRIDNGVDPPEVYADLTAGAATAAVNGTSALVAVTAEGGNRPTAAGTVGAQLGADPLPAISTSPFEVYLNGDLVGTPTWTSGATTLANQASHLETLLRGFLGLGSATVETHDRRVRILPGTGEDDDAVTLADTTGSVAADLGHGAPIENPARFAFAGGGDAAPTASTATLDDGGGTDVLEVSAVDPGTWGDAVEVEVDHGTANPGLGTEFNLTVTEGGTTEVFRNLVLDPAAARYAVDVINGGSALIRAALAAPAPAPTDLPAATTTALAGGSDGAPPGAGELIGSEAAKTGLYALLDVDLFNILCVPDTTVLDDASAALVAAAATALAARERAFYLLDAPHADNTLDLPTEIEAWLADPNNASLRHKNAALYYPRPAVADPLNEFRPREVASSGTMAGVYARTDASRGVWKAPAGTDAVLRGTRGLEYALTDAENGVLNPLGINALRTFPVFGTVAWGARTLVGADQLASEWKYVPIRRLALYIEESLFRGTQWVVFEPNDETLWAQIRLNLGTFMHTLFRQGAFQGASPAKAYFVKCDAENNPQADVDRGVVHIAVGFAPLKPAEFVVIQIEQIAGQLEV